MNYKQINIKNVDKQPILDGKSHNFAYDIQSASPLKLKDK